MSCRSPAPSASPLRTLDANLLVVLLLPGCTLFNVASLGKPDALHLYVIYILKTVFADANSNHDCHTDMAVSYEPNSGERKSMPGEKPIPTLRDVAVAAGVSPMTVSRVINNSGIVSLDKQVAIRAAIKKLQYRPNAAAQVLSKSKSVRIGLLMNDLEPGFMNSMLVGCLRACSKSHVELVLADSESTNGISGAIDKLNNARINGVIIPPPLCENKHALDILAKKHIIIIGLASNLLDKNAISLHIDEHNAAVAVTNHLLSLGHSRIAFITGNQNLAASGLRLSGFRSAHRERSVHFDESYLVEGNFTYRSGMYAAERLLDLKVRPTAIFASNDDMAAGAIAVAHRRGIKVPDELAICGFDDNHLSTSVWPKITTIRQPIEDMSEKAVNIITDNRRNGASCDASQYVFNHSLIIRESSVNIHDKD